MLLRSSESRFAARTGRKGRGFSDIQPAEYWYGGRAENLREFLVNLMEHANQQWIESPLRSLHYHFHYRIVRQRNGPVARRTQHIVTIGESDNPRGHRAVYVSPYHAYLRAAEQVNNSAEGQALLRRRWMVEPTIAWLVRYQGCRQARRVGLAAAECQLLQACAVRNLLLWLVRRKARRASGPTVGGVG